MKNLKDTLILILAIFAITLSGCAQKRTLKYNSAGKVNYPLSPDEVKMLDSIQYATFQYFVHEHHHEWGIVKDRAASWAPASIAATGFALPCFAIGVERKWISRAEAARITLNTLKFFLNSDQSTDTNASGYKGFYYHFLKMNTGTREWNCELSSIDTGLLMLGILFARNYYNTDNSVELEIREKSEVLLSKIDWSFLLMPEKSKHPNTISMAWYPEKGLLDWGWYGYNEGLFLYILAAGSGMKNIETSYNAWLSYYNWETPYPGLSHVTFPPLFGHQFSHAFIDFRGLSDKYMRNIGIDYFENSRRATYAQREYAKQNIKNWIGYDSLCWGFTASDGPGSALNYADYKFEGYAGRGASGPNHTIAEDGTIAPYGPLSSLPFCPEIVLPTIKSINNRYGKQLWGKYGYFDSFNPTAKWVNNDYIGIDQGPMLIMIENFRTGLIWDYVMKDPVIQKGLDKLGFEYSK